MVNKERLRFLKSMDRPLLGFIKKETLAEVFSNEFSIISKNTLFLDYLCVTYSLIFDLKVSKSGILSTC